MERFKNRTGAEFLPILLLFFFLLLSLVLLNLKPEVNQTN